MKKILFIAFLFLTNFVNGQTTQIVYSNVLHGDTLFQLKTTHTGVPDSVIRFNYPKRDVVDSALVNGVMVYTYTQVTDTIPYTYYYFRITNTVKDSIQMNKLAIQPPLQPGVNIKTINSESPLGSGNMTVSGSGGISQQTLNDTAIAIRTTVNSKSDASHVHAYNTLTGLPTLFDGNYNSLSNLPTIPTNTNQLTNGAGFLVAADITGKANLASPTFTGTVSGITAAMVGLGNVNNTSDASKPISTATQTALDTKQATLVSGTNIKTVNGNTLLGSGDLVVSGAPTFLNLAANFSSTSVAEAAVTGWNFPVTTGKKYRIEVIAAYQTAATTTGGELGFFMSASGAGTIIGFAQADIVSTAAATGLKIPITTCTTADAAGSFLISTGVTAINSPHSFYAILTFTCTASGTFNVGWASEVAGSASQLNSNSSLIYQALN